MQATKQAPQTQRHWAKPKKDFKMTNAAFSTWTHPATGAVRIYINAAAFGSTKVWVEQCASDAFGYTYTIRARNDNRSRSELNNTINDAEDLITAVFGSRPKAFEQVLSLAK